MIVVEKHYIDRQHQFFQQFDDLSLRSKNLYNYANYWMRQHFFKSGSMVGAGLNLKQLSAIVKPTSDYKSLPAKVSNQVLKQVIHDWSAWQKSIRAYHRESQQFSSRPKIPKYKHKTCGRNFLIYDNQSIGQRGKKKNNGRLHLSQADIIITTKARDVIEVRIVPKTATYMVDVVYEKAVTLAKLHPKLIASIDLGIDNPASTIANKPTFRPTIYDGKHLKSINRGFNKRRAFLQSQLETGKYTTRQIQQISLKRNKRVENYLHQTSNLIVKRCLVDEQIGQLVIGKNENWKQNVELGKQTNQTFCALPDAKLIDTIAYKSELVGIEVTVTEESYTSKSSFWDLEPVGKQESYQGKRVFRGLFRSVRGTLINADVNAALNMIRKVSGNSLFWECSNRLEVASSFTCTGLSCTKKTQKVR
ncbi:MULTISPECIES: transposase [unclassified Microcoleus]|uniref:transposase n=1 Tax=unclassified Microcoleus TaxID=2642155 RepID=UPI002FD61B15